MTVRDDRELQRRYPNCAARVGQLVAGVRGARLKRCAGKGVRDLPTSRLRPDDDGQPAVVLWDQGYTQRHNRYIMQLFGFPAIHLSDGVTTVTAEAAGLSPTRQPVVGLPPESRTQLIVDFEVREVLDLTCEATVASLGVDPAELVVMPDFSTLDEFGRPAAYELTQCIGEIAYRERAGGIKYQAARYLEGTNIVVFTERLSSLGGSITAYEPITGTEHRLP